MGQVPPVPFSSYSKYSVPQIDCINRNMTCMMFFPIRLLHKYLRNVSRERITTPQSTANRTIFRFCINWIAAERKASVPASQIYQSGKASNKASKRIANANADKIHIMQFIAFFIIVASPSFNAYTFKTPALFIDFFSIIYKACLPKFKRGTVSRFSSPLIRNPFKPLPPKQAFWFTFSNILNTRDLRRLPRNW